MLNGHGLVEALMQLTKKLMLIKVKCLFTYRDSIINKACKDKKSFMYFEDKKLK